MKLWKFVTTVAFVLGFVASANATLVGRLADSNGVYQAYYDTEADLTWLADANYAETSGYDSDGIMNWFRANAWASSLNVGGVEGWRLPNTVDVGNDGATLPNYYQGVDSGFNITDHSELSNMYYNILGNTAWFDTSGAVTGCTVPEGCLTNTGPFNNLQSAYYWSATEYVSFESDAWAFNFLLGEQSVSIKSFPEDVEEVYGNYAWAVHDGDVAALSAVPVPSAVWLFSSGLIGLINIARRKSNA